MKHLRKAIPLLLLLLLSAGVVLAQGTPAINRWVIGGGGGTATGGNVSLSSALGQALAGPSSGGDVAISAGFWCGGAAVVTHTVYLPAVMCNFFADFCEPNNSFNEAHCYLTSGTTYHAYIFSEADKEDYYKIRLDTSHTIEIWLTDIPVGANYHLYLYNSAHAQKGYSGNPDNQDEHILTGSTMPAGEYYIRVQRVTGYSTTQPYALRAVFQ